MPPDRLLTVEEVAEWLAVPRSTLYRWSYSGDGPPVLKVGRRLRYDVADLRKWLQAHRRRP